MEKKRTAKDEQKHKKDLRLKAEQILTERSQVDEQIPKTEADSIRLIHELQVHQIELEMQNEELEAARVVVEASQACYVDLYDLAPVGYCTINNLGVILEANLTVTNMLEVPRKRMLTYPITKYIFKDDQDIYYLHRKQLFDNGETQACELRLMKKDGSPFWVQMTAATGKRDRADETGSFHDETVCYVVITDITTLKEAEKILRNKIEELMAFQRFSVGRELKMIELKKEIDELLGKAGEPSRYKYNKDNDKV
jgi:PAS domain S-box-containing protein